MNPIKLFTTRVLIPGTNCESQEITYDAGSNAAKVVEVFSRILTAEEVKAEKTRIETVAAEARNPVPDLVAADDADRIFQSLEAVQQDIIL